MCGILYNNCSWNVLDIYYVEGFVIAQDDKGQSNNQSINQLNVYLCRATPYANCVNVYDRSASGLKNMQDSQYSHNML